MISPTAYRVIVTAFALYWLALVYGCFVVHVVQPTDFFKESAGLLTGLTALHLKIDSKDEGLEEIAEVPPGTFTKTVTRQFAPDGDELPDEAQ